MLPSLLVFVFCMLSQVHKTFGIQCNQCDSSVSWDDCNKHQVAINCSSIFNRCITYHRILKDRHEFHKGCFHDTSCRSFQCKKSRVTDSWCRMKCCNTTLCNNAVTQSPNDIQTLTPKRPNENGRNSVKDSLQKGKDKDHKPLECYTCSSALSWEDCNKKQKLVKCHKILNVCVTYHRVLTLRSGKNQEHEYEKGCWYDKECSNERCRQTDQNVKGTWCDMRCCNTTQCNPGGFQRQPIGNLAMQVMNTANAAKTQGLFALTAMTALVSGYIS